MSYNPKKGMYKDENGVDRFSNPQSSKTDETKKLYEVSVIRRLVDSKGETIAKNVQKAYVFSSLENVSGFAVRQCPSPWSDSESGIVTRVIVEGAAAVSRAS